MTSLKLRPSSPTTPITWEKPPANFPLLYDLGDNTLQPLLAAALREALDLAGLIVESALIASNGYVRPSATKPLLKIRLGLCPIGFASPRREYSVQLYIPC